METKTNNQSRRLLEIRKFGDFVVEVKAHGTLNTSKGVVFCRDLLNCTLEEITEELQDQGVLYVRRLKTKINGKVVDSPNHLLTFNKTALPKEIKAAFHILKVRPYIPPAIRCFNCQVLGHPASRCAKVKICPCGISHGESEPCQNPKKCVNCGGNHSAAYLNCPKIKEETAIQRIKVIENISYPEAKRKVVIQTPKPSLSYAAASSTQATSPMSLTEILPQIENIIKTTITTMITKPDFRMPTPYNESSRRDRSDSLSTNLSVTSEKRKKPDISTTEEEFEQSCDTNTTIKRKKGWQKGRPRK